MYRKFSATKVSQDTIRSAPKVGMEEGLKKFIDWYKLRCNFTSIAWNMTN